MLAEANGIDFFEKNEHGVSRLAGKTIRNLKDPRQIEKLTGIAQEIPEKRLRSGIEIYNYLRPQVVDSNDLQDAQPAIEKWLGGNLTELFKE